VWWSVLDSNNVIHLDAPSPAPAQAMAVKEDAEESSDFDFGGDSGDGADSLELSVRPPSID
jgi:hypothetical protein